MFGLCLAGPCAAQFTSIVQGSVRDSSEAVIPSAGVRLTCRSTGVVRETTADALGFYRFASLAAGSYELTVRSQGFQIVSVDVPLFSAQTVAVNVTLAVINPSIQEWVVGTSPLLASEDAVTGQQVDRTLIESLPLLNRDIFDLAQLAPGVTTPSGGMNMAHANNFISNGGRNGTADVLLDGVSTVNYEQNSGVQLPLYVPSIDAIQEFRVQQSNFSAEIGFSGGTVVSLLTRSGADDLHGSLSEYFRNDKLDANNFFNNSAGVPIPPLRRNQFGATVGGRILREKTFFFTNYEGWRMRTLASATAGVPTAAMRRGDFGEVCTEAGGIFSTSGRCSVAAGQIWDPYSGVYRPELGGPERTAFVPFNDLGRHISPGAPRLAGTRYQLPLRAGNLIDPVAARLLSLYPMPNGAGQPYSRLMNWFGSGTDRSLNDQVDFKLDHHFSEADRLSAKVAGRRDRFERANLFGNYADVNTQGPTTGGARLLALNHSHTLDAQSYLVLAYGVTRQLAWTRGVGANYPEFDPVETLGMPEYIKASGVTAPPSVLVQGGYASVGGSASIGAQPWSYMKYGQETHHLTGVLSRGLGRHELRVGGEMRAHRINFLQAGTPAGLYLFDVTGTSRTPWDGGGDALASFLAGIAGPNWGQYEIPVAVSTQNFQNAAFVQDNWRATDRLTINAGLRYDLDLPRTERYDRMNWVDPAAVSPVSVPGFETLHGGLAFADAGRRSPFDPDFSNVGPRFGLAYRLPGNTVLRTGYGIYYSLTKGGAAGTGAGGFQGFNSTTPWQVTYQNDGATPWGRLSDPFPDGVLRPPGRSLGLATGLSTGIAGPMRAWNTTPYEQTWTFGFQHAFPAEVLLDASYIGKKGTRLYFGGAGTLNVLPAEVAAGFRTDPAALNVMVKNPFYGTAGFASGALSGPLIPRWRLLAPFPQFASVDGSDPPWANSIYHALQIRVEKRLSHGLQFLATYTASKSIDNASVAGSNLGWLGGAVSLQNPHDLRLERSLSQFDIPQVLQLTYVYRLPFGAGWRGLLGTLAGGWQSNGIWRFSSGLPLSLVLSNSQGVPTWGTQRPDLNGKLVRRQVFSLSQYFANPQVAARPLPYAIGTTPRVLPDVRAPGTAEASLSLFKEFRLNLLREDARLEYRIEAFNAFNHPRFAAPDTTVGSASFGRIGSQANLPRELQMALKLYW